MDWRYLKTLGAISTVVFNLVITIAVLSFLVWKVAIGKNWARIIFMVLSVLGLPFGLHFIRAQFGREPAAGILRAIQVVVQITGWRLVFTALGKNWFKTQPPLLRSNGTNESAVNSLPKSFRVHVCCSRA